MEFFVNSVESLVRAIESAIKEIGRLIANIWDWSVRLTISLVKLALYLAPAPILYVIGQNNDSSVLMFIAIGWVGLIILTLVVNIFRRGSR